MGHTKEVLLNTGTQTWQDMRGKNQGNRFLSSEELLTGQSGWRIGLRGDQSGLKPESLVSVSKEKRGGKGKGEKEKQREKREQERGGAESEEMD